MSAYDARIIGRESQLASAMERSRLLSKLAFPPDIPSVGYRPRQTTYVLLTAIGRTAGPMDTEKFYSKIKEIDNG